MKVNRLYILTVILGILLPLSLKAQDVEIVDIAQKFNDGDYAGARKEASALVKQYPSYDAAYYYMGMCDLYLNNYELAQDEFKTASELAPTNYWYRDRLAVSYTATGDEELTIKTYEKMLEDFPKQTEPYYNLVNLYLRRNQFEKALDAMENIENVQGRSEQITMTRYEIYLHTNQPEKARKALEDFNKDYSSAEITTILGDHHLAEMQDTVAMGYYQEALALDKTYSPALLGVAEVYRLRMDFTNYFSVMNDFVSNASIPVDDKTRYMSALTQQMDGRFLQNHKKDIDGLYSTCISLHGTDSTLLNTAAGYYYKTGRVDATLDMLERNVELYPKSFSSNVTYLQILGTASEWERLRDETDKVYSRFPNEVGLLEFKTTACYNLGDYQGVIDVNQQMIQKAPSDTSITIPAMANIGDMYHQLGDAKNAYKMYNKVLKLRPDYVPVLNNYAYYLSVENKKLSKAYSMSKVCVEKEPDNSTYLDTFGWILYLQGKSAEAKPHFKHAMLYGGKDSAVILDHYAEVLYSLGEYDLAKVYWKQAKDKNTDGSIPDLDDRVAKRLAAID